VRCQFPLLSPPPPRREEGTINRCLWYILQLHYHQHRRAIYIIIRLVWVKCQPCLCILTQLNSHPRILLLDDVGSHLTLPPFPTQERAVRLSAKNKSRYTIKEFDDAVTIQRFRRNLLKRRLKRLRLQLRYRKRQAVIVLQRYTRGMLIRRPRHVLGRDYGWDLVRSLHGRCSN
jgi:hypothetical protein